MAVQRLKAAVLLRRGEKSAAVSHKCTQSTSDSTSDRTARPLHRCRPVASQKHCTAQVMDYQLKRVAGAVHSAGNVLFDGGDRLFSAIGNRIACVDLRRQAADAVGRLQTRSDVDRLALTSDGCLLCAVDVEGRLSCVHTSS